MIAARAGYRTSVVVIQGGEAVSGPGLLRRKARAQVGQDLNDTQVVPPAWPEARYEGLSNSEVYATEADLPFLAGQWMGAAPTTVADAGPRARGSALAAFSLVVGVVALCAVLTGLLAPEGLILGVVGAMLSLAGLTRAGHRGVSGGGTAAVAGLFGIAAAVLAVMAMSGRYPWLDTSDQVAKAHAWLVEHWPWRGRWS
jgi:hypothetical protein